MNFSEYEKSQLKHLQKSIEYIPYKPPLRTFEVGENVRFGWHNNYKARIEEKISDYIYVISMPVNPVEDNDFFLNKNDKTTERQFMYVSYTDIRPCWTLKPEIAQKHQFDFMTHLSWSIGDLIRCVYYDGINFNSNYYSCNWKQSEQDDFLDKIFNGINIGKFAFNQLGEDSNCLYEIIDGKQRLLSLIAFYENRIQYKGIYYNELCNSDRMHFVTFNDFSLFTITHATNEQALKYFKYLERCGYIISRSDGIKMELLKCDK